MIYVRSLALICMSRRGIDLPLPIFLALAAAIWHNWKTDAPVKRSLIAYDH